MNLKQRSQTFLPLRTLLVLMAAIGLLSGLSSFAASKKITVQGVVRRGGSSALASTASLVNNYSPGASVTVTMRCTSTANTAGTCVSSSPRTYTVTANEINSADSTVAIRNGAFSVSATLTDQMVSDLRQARGADWEFIITGQLDSSQASQAFSIPLHAVPFAISADEAGIAQSARTIGGLSVPTLSGSSGQVLTYDGTQFTLSSVSGVTGGGGGGSGVVQSISAGTGIAITGTSAVPIVSVTGINATSLLVGTVPMANLNVGGTTGLVQLAGGTISTTQLSGILGSNIATATINGSNIAAAQIGATHISGISASLVTGAITGSTVNLGGLDVTGAITTVGLTASGTIQGAVLRGVTRLETGNSGLVRLNDADSSNYIDLKGATTVGSNYTLIFPAAAPTNGQILKWDNTASTFTWAADAGASGSISGPSTSTVNAVPRYGASDGSSLLNSAVLIDSSNNITGVSNLTATGALTAPTVNVSTLTGSRFLWANGSNNIVSTTASVTEAEFARVSGVTGNIQTQIDALATGSGLAAGSVNRTHLVGSADSSATALTDNRTYGTTTPVTVNVITRLPASLAHQDCGTTPGSLIFCSGF